MAIKLIVSKYKDDGRKKVASKQTFKTEEFGASQFRQAVREAIDPSKVYTPITITLSVDGIKVAKFEVR